MGETYHVGILITAVVGRGTWGVDKIQTKQASIMNDVHLHLENTAQKTRMGTMGTTIQSIRADLGMAIRKSSTEIIIMHGNLAAAITTNAWSLNLWAGTQEKQKI